MDHVRIDEGIKRGKKRGTRKPRNQIDPVTHRYLPLVPPGERAAAIERAAKRIENGEPLKTIAAEIGVTPQALGIWLLDDLGPEYAVAQRRGLIQRIVNADHEIDIAPDPLSLARAREAARFARWDCERRLPKLFGVHTHMTVEIVGDLGDRLRRARERTIEGELLPSNYPQVTQVPDLINPPTD